MIDPYRGTGRTSDMLMHAYLLAATGKNVLVITDGKYVKHAVADFLKVFRSNPDWQCRRTVRVNGGSVQFAGLGTELRGHRYSTVLVDHHAEAVLRRDNPEYLSNLRTLETNE